MTLKEAATMVADEMAKDKEPGSYYFSWQSNIAMSIKDECSDRGIELDHETVNACAKRFLDLFINS